VVFPLWGESKWRRLTAQAERTRIAVTMDSLSIGPGISNSARQAGVEIGIRLEFDTGFRRCGLPIRAPSVEVAQRIRELPNLRWEGISFYPGHIMGNRAIREHAIQVENSQLDRLLGLLNAAAVPVPVVSGGNTPAVFESHRFHGVTEIRPGTYVFNDRNTVDAEAATYADCAATVIATVVSTSVQGRAIIDAGSKMLSGDQLLSAERRYFGFVCDHPDLILEELSEEHGHVSVGPGCAVRVGDRLRIVPNHICPFINLQDRVYLVSCEEVVAEWKVAGPGMVN
jgi:D-serine deaminase-like pyridoxal phosphate-dependent protein